MFQLVLVLVIFFYFHFIQLRKNVFALASDNNVASWVKDPTCNLLLITTTLNLALKLLDERVMMNYAWWIVYCSNFDDRHPTAVCKPIKKNAMVKNIREQILSIQSTSPHFATANTFKKEGKMMMCWEPKRKLFPFQSSNKIRQQKKTLPLFPTTIIVSFLLCSASKLVAEPLNFLPKLFLLLPVLHCTAGPVEQISSPRSQRLVLIKIWNSLPRLLLPTDVCSSSCFHSFAICKRLSSSSHQHQPLLPE